MLRIQFLQGVYLHLIDDSVEIEPVVPPGAVPNGHPHSSQSLLVLESEPTTNTAHEETPHPCITIRLYGRGVNRSTFLRPGGTL